MYTTIAVYDGRYCLPDRTAFVPQDQDPTVKTVLFLDFVTPKFDTSDFKWCYIFMEIDTQILWKLL
jgi:hypothetical protein